MANRSTNDGNSLSPELLLQFVGIVDEADLSTREYFCLSTVRRLGRSVGPGSDVMPLGDLKAKLAQFAGYPNLRAANAFITQHLQNNKRYLDSRKMSIEQKKQVFSQSPGYRDVVFLTDLGAEKLKAVDDGIKQLLVDFGHRLRGKNPRDFFKTLSYLSTTFSQHDAPAESGPGVRRFTD